MASVLTALASIGNQYAEGTSEGRKEKLDRQVQQQELESRKAFLDLQREAQRRLSDELEFKKKQGDLMEFKDGRIWSVSQGKFIDPARPNPIDSLKEFISKQPKDVQSELETAGRTSLEMDPGNPGKAFDRVEAIAKTYKAEQEKKNKVDPIIAAQIGPRPSPEAYPKGEKDPAYTMAVKKWGVDAETVKNRIASAAASARGQAYGAFRAGPYITPSGDLVTAYAGDAIKQGFVPYTAGFQAMSRTQQIAEMQGASYQLRTAINNLGEDDAFSTAQVFMLRAAANQLNTNGNPTLFSSMISNLAASSLNEKQQDYVIWIQQMGERILSLRNVAGMGQGAQDLREAIQSTLPGFTSGTKQFAMRKLDAVDNQIRILGRGIPNPRVNPPDNTPPKAKTLDQVLDEKFGTVK